MPKKALQGFSWASPEFGVDPYAVIGGLGGKALVYDELLQGWVALRHSDAVEILRSPLFAKNP